MKYLMVKRCEARLEVSAALFATVHGRSLASVKGPLGAVREVIRCQEPLGHREVGHHGSEDDTGRNMFSWAGWGQCA